jgi:hypothetical protein
LPEINTKNEIIELINQIWLKHPSMRFFQLLEWIKHQYSIRNNEFGRREGYEIISNKDEQPFVFIDLFFLEDINFLHFLIDLLKEMK